MAVFLLTFSCHTGLFFIFATSIILLSFIVSCILRLASTKSGVSRKVVLAALPINAIPAPIQNAIRQLKL